MQRRPWGCHQSMGRVQTSWHVQIATQRRRDSETRNNNEHRIANTEWRTPKSHGRSQRYRPVPDPSPCVRHAAQAAVPLCSSAPLCRMISPPTAAGTMWLPRHRNKERTAATVQPWPRPLLDVPLTLAEASATIRPRRPWPFGRPLAGGGRPWFHRRPRPSEAPPTLSAADR